jgi:hypothetical protein
MAFIASRKSAMAWISATPFHGAVQPFHSINQPLIQLNFHRLDFKHGDKSRWLSSLQVFGKLFEEQGPLGKGITVGNVQVAVSTASRGSDSLFTTLDKVSNLPTDTPAQLACLANEVCLSLLRKSTEWVAACSASSWFGANDAGKAESQFNYLVNKEASKFEKVSGYECCLYFFGTAEPR